MICIIHLSRFGFSATFRRKSYYRGSENRVLAAQKITLTDKKIAFAVTEKRVSALPKITLAVQKIALP